MAGSSEKGVALVAAASVPALTEDKIDVIKQTVAKHATDAELAMFLAVAQKYDLDPFAKEIFFIKDPDKPNEAGRTQTGRDGFLAIANRNPAYQGMTSDVVFMGDTYQRTTDGVEHGIDFAERKGTIIGAYALVYRSDRKIPSYAFARFAEYAPKNPPGWSPWHKYPSAMILKVAETIALKKAFSISGMSAIGISEPDDGEPEPQRPETPPLQLPRVPTTYQPPRTARLHETPPSAPDDETRLPSESSETPPGEEQLFPSQDELDALGEDEQREHRDPTA